MFRQFEFREPAQPGRRARRGGAGRGAAVAGRPGALARGPARARAAASASPPRTAGSRSRRPTRSSSAERPAAARGRRSSPTTRRRQRVEAADDTLIAAYLIEPGRATYELDDLAAEYGVELVPEPPADEETARARPARGCHAAAASSRCSTGCGSAALEPLYREVELPLTAGARRDGGRRRQDRHVPDGRDHGAARRAGRGARGEGVRARGRGVHARLDAAGRRGSCSRSSA